MFTGTSKYIKQEGKKYEFINEFIYYDKRNIRTGG